MEPIFEILVKDVLDPLLPAGAPWVVAIDDTTAQKYGPKVAFAGKFRDASCSTLAQPVFHWSHNWVVMCVLLPRARAERSIHIPVAARLFRKREHCAADEFRSHGQIAAEMLKTLAASVPHRRIEALVDPLYNSHLLLNDLPQNVSLVGRLKSNAALYELPPVRQPGQRGRGRRKGSRLPKLNELAGQGDFVPCRLRRGDRWQERLIASFVCVWYRATSQPVRVVIVRDPAGLDPDYSLYSTDVTLAPERIAELYPQRWGIEETIRELKQSLGFESAQSWSAKAVCRQAALSLIVHAVISVGYLEQSATLSSGAAVPSFHRILTMLRLECWQNRIKDTFGATPDMQKFIAPLHALLLTAS